MIEGRENPVPTAALLTKEHSSPDRSVSSHPLSADRVGILMVNLGSPSSPTTEDVRRYLAEFLWDPRLVDLPRPLWWFLLKAVILPFRSRRSAQHYARIWTPEGSPLIEISRRQADLVEKGIRERSGSRVIVLPAMRYGQPSIASGLEALRAESCGRILVLPMYPQNSSTTTASVYDAVAVALAGWRWVPEIRFVSDFHDDPGYTGALANSIREVWEQSGPADKLVVSYHGLPARYIREGDPYQHQCLRTTKRMAEDAGLDEEHWVMAFQSRFGRQEWIRPYTDETLLELARAGTTRVDVLCPGFTADCLETLEEIAVTNQSLFLTAGGGRYRYIPALNVRPDFMETLTNLCLRHLCGWPGFPEKPSV